MMAEAYVFIGNNGSSCPIYVDTALENMYNKAGACHKSQ